MTRLDWVAEDARIEGSGVSGQRWSKGELLRRVEECGAGLLRAVGNRARIGLIAENSPLWIAIDLAAQSAGIDLVPLPGFFSMDQLLHAIRASRLDAMLCPAAGLAASLGFTEERFDAGGLRLFAMRAADARHVRPRQENEAHKITFTSGTTGNPKGVVLSTRQQLHAVAGLVEVAANIGIRRHLCVLPLPVLLENVAGAYTALTIGATCICPPLGEIGLNGSSAFDPERCLDAIGRYRPDSMILLPQMLKLLVARLARAGAQDPRIRPLRYVTVGGAKTPVELIERARMLGLPVYEGYGLTECASVVSVNAPGADRPGTVGCPLPGVKVRVSSDGELEIGGRAFSGYLGSDSRDAADWIASGDLGAIDADGFISILGRKKNVIVTSYGRNVSPEWPESLLLNSPAVAQAAVYGDGCPHLIAVLVAASRQISDADLQCAVGTANARLPDYARVGQWIRAREPFTAWNGLATGNGRVRRAAVEAFYRSDLTGLQQGAE
jgi:long-subunit acyl-CoA synthetase (AMP-forming)